MDETATVNTLGEPTYSFPAEPVLSRNLLLVKKAWASFHNSIVLAMIFTLIGVGVGVKASKDFYSSRIDEVIQTGALLHKAKVYTINIKP